MMVTTYYDMTNQNLDSAEKKQCVFSVKRIIKYVSIVIITKLYSYQYYSNFIKDFETSNLHAQDQQFLIIVEYM